jgi:hypothetical protein
MSDLSNYNRKKINLMYLKQKLQFENKTNPRNKQKNIYKIILIECIWRICRFGVLIVVPNGIWQVQSHQNDF